MAVPEHVGNAAADAGFNPALLFRKDILKHFVPGTYLSGIVRVLPRG